MNIQESTLPMHRLQRYSFSCLLLISGLFLPSAPGRADGSVDQLQTGVNDMYNLSFDDAHRVLEGYEKDHPRDPRGPVFDAAGYLFSEFDRLRILQSEFFVNDHNFFTRKPLAEDPAVKIKFDNALTLADRISEERLKKSADDQDALFASAMSMGLRSDYTALVEKRNFQALGEVKIARETAQTLLAKNPKYYDAYLALGVENYLLSQKPAPVRWILHLGGAQTDKEAGLTNLRITAAKGQYLQPYAQLLLAVAALRDKNKEEAHRLLSDLATRFPKNSLYREELKKL